jgi:uncharacterized protein YbcV (DUF1398 family)
MNPTQAAAANEAARLSAGGQIHFGQVVERLIAAGFERYHADYSRSELTYYTPEGDTCTVDMQHDSQPIAPEFQPRLVAAAVQQSQRGEIMYPEFTRQALAAGCVGYFVQLTGRRVQYFGRAGDMHVEWFPGARPEAAT